MPGVWAFIAAGAALLILAVLEMVREQRTFRVTHYVFETEKIPAESGEIRIAFLSDLHNQVYGADNQKLYDAVADIRPDLILIGGDMLTGKKGVSPDAALSFTERLPGICPVFYANGNHEQRMKVNTAYYGTVYAQYKERLEKAGVRFLENESVSVCIRGACISVSGLELPLSIYEKFKKHRVGRQMVDDCLKTAPEETAKCRILLAHNPVFFRAYKDWGADLVLSGHLHGGIIRIPGLGGLITPQAVLFPRYSGEMTREGNSAVIVSRGLGTHTVRIRLFNTAEVVSVSLRNK